MSNELVGWLEDFDITEEERRSGFVREIEAPPGVLRPWTARVTFETAPAGPHLLRVETFRKEKGLLPVAFDFDDEEHLEGPAPEPLQEEPLQGQDREAPAADGGVGAPGPLPDADAEQGEVVEGVGGLGEAEARMFQAARQVLDDLHFAYCAARSAGLEGGILTARRGSVTAEVQWPYSEWDAARGASGAFALSFYVEGKPDLRALARNLELAADWLEGKELVPPAA